MYTFDVINSIRKKCIDLLSNISLEDANKIPEGFNNNIAWNFGHLVVSGYSLVFKATQADPNFQIPLVDKFRKGTKPEGFVTQDEINELIELSNNFTLAVKEAWDAGRFNNITSYTTETLGVPITTIEEMITTVAIHDSIHSQVMRDFKRVLGR